jgi:hypothetical protein
MPAETKWQHCTHISIDVEKIIKCCVLYTAPPDEKPDYLLSLSIDGAGLSPFNQRAVESPQTRIAPTLSHQFIPFIVHNTIKGSMCVSMYGKTYMINA